MTDSPIPLYLSKKPRDASGIILHGLLGNNQSMQELAGYLSTPYLIPDLVGHGKSPSPNELKHYTLDAMASQIHKITEESLQTPFDLIGYSMGARLALRYAIENKNDLRSLTLIGGTPGIQEDASRHQRALDDVRKVALLEDRGILEFINFWEKQPIFSSQRRLPAEKLLEQRRIRLTTKPMPLANHLRASGSGVMNPLWNQIHELCIPVLILVGAYDAKYIEIGERMKSIIPMSTLKIINGAGHAVHLEKPEESANAINKFIGG
ncbi:MAG: 2-succinyl-6-hydroxy-2,4-cyclohexadiene-1-carboxylate synthase [Acidimicrobiaceae bacterium]|jgi:2-succinyl-6-hydroxy-2,4-cyclohexadiene-1-carboxylate synthase|nr:2-succinyl-6-hydroxy-2,4-cyclohexadiene-1-carboxylate synthase [Acidimicrobiaceae bacterium]|tara:strand:+ start:68460 stop:69254 length:795 start_codon:yes stop_codon:yes gene_type:complete